MSEISNRKDTLTSCVGAFFFAFLGTCGDMRVLTPHGETERVTRLLWRPALCENESTGLRGYRHEREARIEREREKETNKERGRERERRERKKERESQYLSDVHRRRREGSRRKGPSGESVLVDSLTQREKLH